MKKTIIEINAIVFVIFGIGYTVGLFIWGYVPRGVFRDQLILHIGVTLSILLVNVLYPSAKTQGNKT